MIGYLNGTVILQEEDFIIVNVNGVGYKVFVPKADRILGQNIELFVTTFFKEKEENIILFGFSTRFDQQVFEILCEANGLGPKTALKFLSSMTGQEIANAMVTGNEMLLTTIPGVSSKKAQKYILELKDKFAALPVDITLKTGPVATFKLDAVDALVALGYSRIPAQRAVDQVVSESDLKDVNKIITKALSLLSKNL
ncbi:MAG: Holliday junction branch migration protein RuvA [Abditibacteriota bacterium]|nr:Holliday junction branch migration protein RuvA [Abditibacteriota bacterium]